MWTTFSQGPQTGEQILSQWAVNIWKFLEAGGGGRDWGKMRVAAAEMNWQDNAPQLLGVHPPCSLKSTPSYFI